MLVFSRGNDGRERGSHPGARWSTEQERQSSPAPVDVGARRGRRRGTRCRRRPQGGGQGRTRRRGPARPAARVGGRSSSASSAPEAASRARRPHVRGRPLCPSRQLPAAVALVPVARRRGGSSGWSAAARVAGRSIGGHTRSSGRTAAAERSWAGWWNTGTGAGVGARGDSSSSLKSPSPQAACAAVSGSGSRGRGRGGREGSGSASAASPGSLSAAGASASSRRVKPRARSRDVTSGPLPVHGELLQLGWGHLVEELVEGGFEPGAGRGTRYLCARARARRLRSRSPPSGLLCLAK
jgi:hypothetical protein